MDPNPRARPAPDFPPDAAPAGAAWRVGLGAGALAFLAVCLTLGGPGLTTDEPLDVGPGRQYVATLRARGWAFFEPRVADAVFRNNAEHPPLGRWLLGLASTLGEPFEIMLSGGPDPTGLYVLSARLAPASAFAALLGLVAGASARRYGTASGVAAGFALFAMPRAFAHAHLAALDTFIALFWTLALLAAARAADRPRPVAAMALAGFAWGLALLTKIHAWFLPPLVLAWAWYRLGARRGSAAVTAWVAAGLATFLAGWPWLWHDTAARLRAYLGTGVERMPLRVLYFGQVYADRDVPWHYPWFYAVATVPLGLHLLGLLGLFRGWRDRRRDAFPCLVAAAAALFPAVFSTNVPVYDGERLFLVAFPLGAILIGRGFAEVWPWARSRPWRRAAIVAAVLVQGYGTVAFHPFGLSYYNALVGGLPGAERLGLELTYWGDAVDGVLLGRLAMLASSDDSAALAPTLYPGQGAASTTRAMARLPLVLGDEDAVTRADWIVVSRRTAYWSKELRDRLATGHRVAARRRQGVWLSGLWRITKPSPHP